MGIQGQSHGATGKKAPKAKDKQDEAIIGTNDYSIVSKRSVEKFYYKDEPQFLRAFVHKFKRRAPLVNRGYWLRMRAIEAVVRQFLDESSGRSKAIVNLGCGYEPLAFRMLWKYPANCKDVKFVDLDFPQLIEKKVQMVRKETLLHERLTGEENIRRPHDSIKYASEQYCAVGCDLGNTHVLQEVLRTHLEIHDRAILFISEVAVVYMPPEEATGVISLCSTFPDARFCLLEQCLPAGGNHPFAATMDKHFKGTPLRGLREFPTIASQRERFTQLGWYNTYANDLWSLWQNDGFIGDDERRGLDDVEPFDEWEGLALWAGHNLLLLASTKQAQYSKAWIDNLLPNPVQAFETSLEAVNVSTNPLSVHPGYGRTNGAAFSVGANTIVHYGGTVLDAKQGSIDTYIRSGHEGNKVSPPPANLSFATMTDLAPGRSLLAGGRASPHKPSSSCFIREGSNWHKVADLVPARFRHCAAAVSSGDHHGVLVFGGKTGQGKVLDHWMLFSDGQWQPVEVEGGDPPASFGATMIATSLLEGLLVGGMDQNGKLVADTEYSALWTWSLVWEYGSRPRAHVARKKHGRASSMSQSLSRFGAASVSVGRDVLVIGGIGLRGPIQPYEELIVIRGDGSLLACHNWSTCLEAMPMLVGHSAIMSGDSELLLFGGGTVCFSYGSHWNPSLQRLRIGHQADEKIDSWTLMASFELHNKSVPQPDANSQNEDLIKTALVHPLKGTSIQRLLLFASIAGHIRRDTSRPYVISGLDIGPCTRLWSPDYLKAKVGVDKQTVIHAASSPHLSFHDKNFAYSTVPFGKFVDDAAAGSPVYMRALSTTEPSKKPANLAIDYPGLAADFRIPETLSFAGEHQHSSVLRISGSINMWLHYDVMGNLLCQVTGSKRVILFPPQDVARLAFPPGETTSNIDVFSLESEKFVGCSPVEAILNAGDILFTPACWPHVTAPASESNELSVAVNVFFRSLDDSFYAAGRDVYGNRDLEMYQNGRKHIAQMQKSVTQFQGGERNEILVGHAATMRSRGRALDLVPGGKEVNRIMASARDLPHDLAEFYLLRLAAEIESLADM